MLLPILVIIVFISMLTYLIMSSSFKWDNMESWDYILDLQHYQMKLQKQFRMWK